MPFPESVNGSKGDTTGKSDVFKLSDKESCATEVIHDVRRMMLVKSSNANINNTGDPWSRDEMACIIKARHEQHPDLNGHDIAQLWSVIMAPKNTDVFMKELRCDKYYPGFKEDLERYNNGWRAGMKEGKRWP